jgi:hypothetical protein
MARATQTTTPQRMTPNSETRRTIQRTFNDRWANINLKDLARQHTETAIETLVEIMTDGDAQASARLTAANSLLDRGWGKAGQHTEISVDVYDRMSDAELISFIADALPKSSRPMVLEHEHNDASYDEHDDDERNTDDE